MQTSGISQRSDAPYGWCFPSQDISHMLDAPYFQEVAAGWRPDLLAGRDCPVRLECPASDDTRWPAALHGHGHRADAAARLPSLGLDLSMPDHTTLSRRSRTFAARQPRAAKHDGPLRSVLNSTDLKVFGQASGMPRNTAIHPGNGASCIWPSMPRPAKLWRTC